MHGTTRPSPRPFCFWNLNDRITEPEIVRQIAAYAAAGLSGVCLHPRAGFRHEYLSAEWFALVDRIVAEARKQRLEVWIWDEFVWPAGFASGRVNALGVDYQAKYLRFDTVTRDEVVQEAETLGFYTPDGTVFYGRERPADAAPDAEFLRAYFQINPCYVDNLEPRCTAKFIEFTHEAYAAQLAPDTVAGIRGFFTDEPQLSRDGLLWSFRLEPEWRERYGEALLPLLPALRFDHFPGAAAIRVRFWQLVAVLFRAAYIEPLRRVCDRHHWELIGHHAQEDALQIQIDCNGDVMYQYPGYHIIGIDQLCAFPVSSTVCLQAASVAAQQGDRLVMSETFAVAGWNLTFQEMRYLLEQQMIGGINFFCMNMGFYSLEGLRKREYPPSIFCHQPYWPEYGRVVDYFARVNTCLTAGENRADIAILHPLSSAWCLYHGDDGDAAIDRYTRALAAVVDELRAQRLPAHLIDEMLFADSGSVKAGQLKLGVQHYPVVVVPPVGNLSAGMVKALRRFAADGGCLWRLRPWEELRIDGGTPTADVAAWWAAVPTVADAAQLGALLAAARPHITATTADGANARQIQCVERRTATGIWLYLANIDLRHRYQVTVTVPATGRVERLTGEATQRTAFPVRSDGATLQFDWDFVPAGDLLLFVTTGEAAAAEPEAAAEPVAVRTLSAPWHLTAPLENLLTLDRCRYRIDGGDWVADDVSEILPAVLAGRRDCEVEMEFTIRRDAALRTDAAIDLLLECPERCTVELNAVPVDLTAHDWYLDPAFRRVALPPVWRPGDNILRLRRRNEQDPALFDALERAKIFESEANKISYRTEYECLYLVGDFRVEHVGTVERHADCCGPEAFPRPGVRYNGDFVLAPSRSELDPADPVGDGLPFFAGRIACACEVELTADEAEIIDRLAFQTCGLFGVAVKVNGLTAGTPLWAPYEVDVRGLWRAGRNRVELEFATSLRNLLGPFHLEPIETTHASPWSFNKKPYGGYHPGYGFCPYAICDVTLLRSR